MNKYSKVSNLEIIRWWNATDTTTMRAIRLADAVVGLADIMKNSENFVGKAFAKRLIEALVGKEYDHIPANTVYINPSSNGFGITWHQKGLRSITAYLSVADAKIVVLVRGTRQADGVSTVINDPVHVANIVEMFNNIDFAYKYHS